MLQCDSDVTIWYAQTYGDMIYNVCKFHKKLLPEVGSENLAKLNMGWSIVTEVTLLEKVIKR